MFKKVLFASAVVVAGLGFTACSSDDDNPTVEANPLVGEWKAETISYDFVNPQTGETMTNTHPFSHPMISEGCDVDELELRANNVADLEIESKVDNACVESHIAGTWNDTSVTIEGETPAREVVSVTATELKLKYMMTFPAFGTTEVTVTYLRS